MLCYINHTVRMYLSFSIDFAEEKARIYSTENIEEIAVWVLQSILRALVTYKYDTTTSILQ